MPYSDNDDDIFDYDPEQDFSSNLQSDSYQNISSSDKSTNTIISSAKDIFDDLVSDNSFGDTIDESKVKLCISFQAAAANYFSKIQTPAYTKSISMVLDTLTNGDFSMIQMFNHKEALITQRLRYICMMKQVIHSDTSDDSIMEQLFSLLNISYDKSHVEIFYTSNLNIATHALHVDRAIYKALGKKLNLPLKEELLDDTYVVTPEHFLSSLNDNPVDDYFNIAYSKIIRKIADEGVLSELSELYGTNYTLYSNE